ncbi:MAG: HD domain-containing protein [Dehalococcoidia bacterium]|nr:HD domain-containing protein [Dehalococcoidia bacterium]
MDALRQRVRQFREAGAVPSPDDFRLARELLEDEALFALFARQEPRDVVHAVNTARWLLARGHEDAELVQAALLHDIGKGRQRTRDRVGWVVAETLGAGGWLADERSPLELRRAFARTRDHSDAGADWLVAAGADVRVVELTRLHHGSPGGDAMLALLQAADAAS